MESIRELGTALPEERMTPGERPYEQAPKDMTDGGTGAPKLKRSKTMKNRLMTMKRRIGISTQPASTLADVPTTNHGTVVIERFPKSPEEKKRLMDAFRTNSYMGRYEDKELVNFINGLERFSGTPGEIVIREREMGTRMYVAMSGEVDVSTEKNGHVCKLAVGTLFGEVALIHTTTRNATVTVSSGGPCEGWSLENSTYRSITRVIREGKQNLYKTLLRNSSLFEEVNEVQIKRCISSMAEVPYATGDYIVHEGYIGLSFFVVIRGTVRITKNTRDGGEYTLAEEGVGCTFGERAMTDIFTDGLRRANVVATSDVECLVMSRVMYLAMLRTVDYRAVETSWARIKPPKMPPKPKLSELSHVAQLGAGGFGRVVLVKHKGKLFALKCMQKNHIVAHMQQEHVLNERYLMIRAQSPFIVRLHATYRDRGHVYMLMDACLGGDLFACRKRVRRYATPEAQFIVASIVEAITYLHDGGVAFRDLKPENVMVDERGYVKLTDFGFARYIAVGQSGWTFVGTPEYCAPEVIMCVGHTLSCDCWSLGVLIYELLVGDNLFGSSEDSNVYRTILNGVGKVKLADALELPAKDIVQRLCRFHEETRLSCLSSMGATKLGIRAHPWFDGFPWEALRAQSIQSVLMPCLLNSTDTSKFDPFVCTFPPFEEEISGWDFEFDEAVRFARKPASEVVDDAPAGDAPAGDAPAGDAPAEGIPAGDAPADEAPAAPADDAPAAHAVVASGGKTKNGAGNAARNVARAIKRKKLKFTRGA